MFGANVRDIGVNPYRNTYTSFVQNKNSGKVSEKSSEKIVETVCNGSSEKSDTVKFPGDVTIDYPPKINNALNNNSDNVNIQSLVSTAASSYEKSIEMVSHDKI